MIVYIYWVLTYLTFSTALALYVYFDTLKDSKFRAAALQFALAMYAWPAVLIFIIYVTVYVRIKEWRKT